MARKTNSGLFVFPEGAYNHGADFSPDGDHLYFVRNNEGFCKIGRSKDCAKRMRNLSIASATPLYPVLMIPLLGWQERVWHAAFAQDRANGEWFRWSDGLARAVEAARSGDEWIATLALPTNGMPLRYTTVYQWRDHIADLEEAAVDQLHSKMGDAA